MDQFNEAYWNADQLLVWVWRRDRELVRRAADGFTDYGTGLQELKLPDGRVAMAETPGCWMGLSCLSLLPDMQARRNLNETLAEALNVLREGRLHARGLKNGDGDLEKISDGQWAGLGFYEDRDFRTYASPDDHWRHKATKWYGLKFKRAEILVIWPDPLIVAPEVRSILPLRPLQADTLGSMLKLDGWTMTEALHVLHGNEPPPSETTQRPFGCEDHDQAKEHFPRAHNYAINSAECGVLCTKKTVAGKVYYIESPAKWFSWALEKGLPVADMVRTEMLSVGYEESPDRLPPVKKSGVPGHPTSKHLFIAELERRANAGELKGRVAQEGQYLSGWLAQNYPDWPQVKPLSCENAIRAKYRRLKPVSDEIRARAKANGGDAIAPTPDTRHVHSRITH